MVRQFDYLLSGVSRRIATATFLLALFTASPARAQYSGNNQTNVISGVTSNWTGLYHIGVFNFNNALIISNAGVLGDGDGYLGSVSAGGNSALVTDIGSVWTNQNNVIVGNTSGNNSLTITNGGKVVSNGGQVGSSTGSDTNRVLITGSGSVWSNKATSLTFGNSGFGNQMTISDGGAVFSVSGRVGNNTSSSNNSVTVTGGGSVWNNSDDLDVGFTGRGNTLTITNGGAVFNTDGYVGTRGGTFSNVVTVSGNGASWNNRGVLYVGGTITTFGGADTNTLNIGTGGSVIASNAILGGFTGADGNKINITGGSLFVTNAPGTGTLDIRRGTLTFDSGIVTADKLVLNNGNESRLDFNAGSLSTRATFVTNGIVFAVGDGAGASATLNLLAGTHSFSNGVSIASDGRLQIVGATATVSTPSFLVNNVGGIVTGNNARLTVSGTYTNAGTFTMLNSVGTFNGAVVNSGAWVTDPTTNIFTTNFIHTASGFISATVGDVFIFTNSTPAATYGSFINRSTNNAAWNTAEAKFLFDATLAVTQDFYAAGHDLGPASVNSTSIVTGNWAAVTVSNFSLGILEIANFSTVRVWDAFSGLGGEFGTNDGLRAALYVSNLVMSANSFLIISSNVEVYFLTSNSWGAANFTLLGGPHGIGGELHQFENVAVPEPSVLLLWFVGAGTVYAYRRRAKRSTSV